MDNPMSIRGDTYAWASSTSESDITLTPEDRNASRVIVYNATAYFVVITAGETAATASLPTSASVPVACQVVAPGATMTYEKRPGFGVLSLIQGTADAGKYVYVTVGSGE